MGDSASQEAVVKRLKRIEGQVSGIQNMIESGRDCESILVQIAAVRSAVEGVGALVLNNYTKLCFRDGGQADPVAIASLARAIAVLGSNPRGGRLKLIGSLGFADQRSASSGRHCGSTVGRRTPLEQICMAIA